MTAGDVEGEDAGEQVGPAEAAGLLGGGQFAGAVAGVVGEVERELLAGRVDDGMMQGRR